MSTESGIEAESSQRTGSPVSIDGIEVFADPEKWRPATFRFRLVGIADMRGDLNAFERPSPPEQATANSAPEHRESL